MKLNILTVFCCFCLLAVNSATSAPETHSIKLPKPALNNDKSLLQALQNRQSSRSFSNQSLPLATTSNLLWAAFGINRPDGKRTAPSAVNWQEIDIYVATAEGLYLFEAQTHSLTPILAKDIRSETGKQGFVKEAPLVLIFVANLSKMTGSKEDNTFYAATDTGFISQNVYLYCASEELNTVVLGLVDKKNLRKVMGLAPHQKIILTQPVGYPK